MAQTLLAKVVIIYCVLTLTKTESDVNLRFAVPRRYLPLY